MAARFGFDCTIYMGEVDVKRQFPNVFWMKQLGAEVVTVKTGQRTLKDAISDAMRDWANTMDTTHYVLGTACGPHPFPEMVSWFQSVVGLEALAGIKHMTKKLPDKVYACVGGGSNAMGIFSGFIDEKDVELVGVEAGGRGMNPGDHAARLAKGTTASTGIAHCYKTEFLQDSEGQMTSTHSVSAGLDYMGVSPILAYLKDTGRVRFEAARDEEVVNALKMVMKYEGIIPALESAHAFAQAIKEAPAMSRDKIILVNQSGRGDKDIFTVADAIKDADWIAFLKSQVEGYHAE